MMLAFDLGEVVATEFGVGRDDGGGPDFTMVPVEFEVQTALREMAQATWNAMQRDDDGAVQYEPSEKHGSTEYVFLPSGDRLETAMRALHTAENLPIGAAALEETDDVFCYYARFTDRESRRLTAMRRASQFKGVLKKRIVRVTSDSLRIVKDKMFALDSDFDVLIDFDGTHIWRPSSFEYMGNLRQEILDAVPANISSIQRDLGFLDFGSIGQYASTHPRAARYLASIRSQDLVGVTSEALLSTCMATGVEVEETGGRVTVANGHIMGFLEVLDRRRYQVELVPDAPEQFKATSRRRIES